MRKITRSYKLIVMLLIGSVIASCTSDKQIAGYEFMPDMYRSSSYKSYSQSKISSDTATSALLPVEGTIPRNFSFFSYPNTNEGYEAAGAEVVNPLEYTEKNLQEGAKLYNDYCTHCHGDKGDGQGTLVKNGKFPPPPAYTSDQLKDLPVGKMYWTIMHGKNLMGSHASQLSPEERWKVIMHVEKLQKGETEAEEASDDDAQGSNAESAEETAAATE